MTEFKEVRVRIAPSPTGDPHVGTAYIALFNYVFAKQNGGSFILRIEDTDQSRSRSSSEAQILSSLKWLGLQWDEGPDSQGQYGPYRQSERLDIYKKHCDLLVEENKAYPCYCSSERLEQLRAEQRARGEQTRYDGHCRDLTPEERKLKGTSEFVIRLKTPDDGISTFNDELRGPIEIENARIDDQVLLKTDGYPTYHLANVVDDHLMRISHVIRAEEWISSTPKHVLLYEAFGWEKPKFIHMPLLRNTDKSKISKRKNPVSLLYYQRAGILAKTMVNFLALMGWSFGDDKEIFSLSEMIEAFDWKKISLGGPVFDQVKLTWLNQHYIQTMDEREFVAYLRNEVYSEDYLSKIAPLMKERVARFDQFADKTDFFFNGSLNYEGLDLVPKAKTKEELVEMLSQAAELVDEMQVWDIDAISQMLSKLKDQLAWKPKDFFMPLRLVATGRKDSPPLNETLEVLGREMVRFRLRDACKFLSAQKD